jgi:hypothetical protein
MGRLIVERRGGLVGMVVKGEIDEESLSDPDRAALNEFFRPERPTIAPQGADRFRYLITRITKENVSTVEIPEHLVPRAIADAVRFP